MHNIYLQKLMQKLAKLAMVAYEELYVVMFDCLLPCAPILCKVYN